MMKNESERQREIRALAKQIRALMKKNEVLYIEK